MQRHRHDDVHAHAARLRHPHHRLIHKRRQNPRELPAPASAPTPKFQLMHQPNQRLIESPHPRQTRHAQIPLPTPPARILRIMPFIRPRRKPAMKAKSLPGQPPNPLPRPLRKPHHHLPLAPARHPSGTAKSTTAPKPILTTRLAASRTLVSLFQSVLRGAPNYPDDSAPTASSRSTKSATISLIIRGPNAVVRYVTHKLSRPPIVVSVNTSGPSGPVGEIRR